MAIFNSKLLNYQRVPHFLRLCHCFHPIGLRLGDFFLRYHAWVRLSELLQLEVSGKSGHLHGLRSTIPLLIWLMCIYIYQCLLIWYYQYQWLTINIYGLYQCLYQWIGLRGKLQESPIFHWKIYGFLQIFP